MRLKLIDNKYVTTNQVHRQTAKKLNGLSTPIK